MRRSRSLTLKVTVTLLVALISVFLTLLLVMIAQVLRDGSGDLDKTLKSGAEAFLAGIETVNSEEAANAVLGMFAQLQHSSDENEARPLSHVLLISRVTGVRIASEGTPSSLKDLSFGVGLSRVHLDKANYRCYLAIGHRWNIVFIDQEDERRRDVIVQSGMELATYMGIAIPLLFLPVWLAVKSGMRPLRQLSEAVRHRSPEDLSPLHSVGSYAELIPLENALNQQFSRSAERLLREKAFVQDAAHELRTPLAVIASQAHVLAKSEGPARVDALHLLESAVERGSHLVGQLLSLARADANSSSRAAPSSSSEAVFDLMELVRDLLAQYEPTARKQNCEIELDAPDTVVIQGDAQLFRSVLSNLIDNALKYGGGGGLVAVSLNKQANEWRLTVSDNGPGLPEEGLTSAFERFWRGSHDSVTGTGLGLAIVREVMRGLGGDAVLSNRPGGGCIAVVWWPASVTAPESEYQ